MRRLPIAALMRPTPGGIPPAAPLAAAHRAMAEQRVRHLVVLDGGRLVGVVSLDDLHLIESLGDVDPLRVPVEDAMTRDVYTVAPDEAASAVGAGMMARGTDTAVVIEEGQVAGLFTTDDALAALVALIGPTVRDTGRGIGEGDP
jgi:acetoin utilization protein AcuB